MASRSDRWLDAFAEWFASKGGVYETALVVVAWTIVASVWRSLDPHLFLTMAILTIYSAITQPVLAYCNQRATERANRDSAEIKAEEDQILDAVQHPGGAT